MKRFTGHREPWGEFVDVKVNAPELLEKELARKKKGTVWLSGVCDPYQPLEAHYGLTRRCLEILTRNGWPVVIQTRSPLVLRDLDILTRAENVEAGLSVTTADDAVRQAFEPLAPPIAERLRALEALHRAGVRTYAMIAPILPGAENLVSLLEGIADYVIIDRMNYHHADRIYEQHGWQDQSTDAFFEAAGRRPAEECRRRGIPCTAAY
jgi:DNA repair photolyase